MRYTSTISSRYFESSTVCYVLILTYILSPVEHMHKIMNSDQTGKGHRKRVGKDTFLNHHDITSWDLQSHSHQSATFAHLQHPWNCVEFNHEKMFLQPSLDEPVLTT